MSAYGEPWKSDRNGLLWTHDGYLIKSIVDIARVVACVNACAGITDEALSAIPKLIEAGQNIEAALAFALAEQDTIPPELNRAFRFKTSEDKAYALLDAIQKCGRRPLATDVPSTR